MAFLVRSHRLLFQLFLNCFKPNQTGFEQVFDNLTFKRMDAFCFWIHAMVSKF